MESPEAAEGTRMERLMVQLRLIFAMKYAHSDPTPSQLADFLYIGSVGAAMNKATLKDTGITHILIVADKLTPMFPGEFTYLNIALLDAMDANLLEVLPRAISFINTARESGGKVLVHCFAGRSRSASVCIAYLMQTSRVSLMEALHFVRQRREAVMPNTGFMQQLKTFERSLAIAPGVQT